MDRRNILDTLYTDFALYKHGDEKARSSMFSLWLCACVGLWDRWDILKKSLSAQNGYVNLEYSFSRIHPFEFAQSSQTLTIPKKSTIVHIFEKAVCVQIKTNKDYWFYPYDLQTNQAMISESDWKDFLKFRQRYDGDTFYLLKGAVTIANREYYSDITLTYIQIEP